MNVTRTTLKYPTDYECSACLENPFEKEEVKSCTWYGHVVNRKENLIIHGICQECLSKARGYGHVLNTCSSCRIDFPNGREIIVISREGELISQGRQTEPAFNRRIIFMTLGLLSYGLHLLLPECKTTTRVHYDLEGSLHITDITSNRDYLIIIAQKVTLVISLGMFFLALLPRPRFQQAQ